MLIIALVLAVIGLAALVTAVVTSNELIAWVCIAASLVGVVLLIVDALRDRSRRGTEDDTVGDGDDDAEREPDRDYVADYDADYPDEPPTDEQAGGSSVDPDDREVTANRHDER